MNSTTSNFGINSFFTYDEAKKYFESTNLDCKSDNDCLEGSNCIGNKCHTSFYCKDGDDSKCSLFKNICNGKPCFKPDNKCDKGEDCLSGHCLDNKCFNQYSPRKKLINEYTFSSFTYENARNYYKKLNITCSSDGDCPNHTYCINDYRAYEHSSYEDCSKEEGCSYCSSDFYCNKDKSICSFSRDEQNDIRFSSKMSAVNDIFGLENGEECRRNKECIIGRCGCGYTFFESAECRGPSDSDSACAIPILLILGPLFGIECIIILFIFIVLIDKLRLKRKNLIKSKHSTFKLSLKSLTITGCVIGALFLLFFIYFFII